MVSSCWRCGTKNVYARFISSLLPASSPDEGRPGPGRQEARIRQGGDRGQLILAAGKDRGDGSVKGAVAGRVQVFQLVIIRFCRVLRSGLQTDR